jgi:hypothetical protein
LNKIAKIPGKFVSPLIEHWESYHRRLLEIKNLTTAAEVWKKLCSLHEDKSEIVAVDRRAHLQNLRMLKGGNIRVHMGEMERVREELSGLGAPVNDSDFSAMMLSSLPQSYRQWYR